MCAVIGAACRLGCVYGVIDYNSMWEVRDLYSGLFHNTYFLTYLLPTALASLITDAHSFLSSAFCRHPLKFISCRSFPTSSSHLILGLPILPFPSALFSDIFLTTFSWSILTGCPIHSNLLFLMSATMSKSSHIFRNAYWTFILHILCSTTGTYILVTLP